MTEISIGGLPLETLAEMANEAAELAERDMVSAVGRAWDCGRYLLAAKAQVPHGQWMHWVRVNFDRELRTACRYMQLAGAFESRAAIAEAASIRQAMRMISQSEETTDEPEPELVEEIEAEPEVTPEIEPQERPSIRTVSAESRKVSKADREPTPKVPPVVQPELVEEAEEAVVLYSRSGQGYVVADADEVAAAALQLHEPMSLVRMAVMAVPPKDMAWAVDELQQAIKWLQSEIEEAERRE